MLIRFVMILFVSFGGCRICLGFFREVGGVLGVSCVRVCVCVRVYVCVYMRMFCECVCACVRVRLLRFEVEDSERISGSAWTRGNEVFRRDSNFR